MFLSAPVHVQGDGIRFPVRCTDAAAGFQSSVQAASIRSGSTPLLGPVPARSAVTTAELVYTFGSLAL